MSKGAGIGAIIGALAFAILLPGLGAALGVGVLSSAFTLGASAASVLTSAVIGAAVGAALGGALFGDDPSAPKQDNPDLADTDISTNRTEIGTTVPVVYGNGYLYGPLFFVGDFEKEEETEAGIVTKQWFVGSWAVAVSEGEIRGITGVWYNEQTADDLKDDETPGGVPKYTVFKGTAGQNTWSKVQNSNINVKIPFIHLAYIGIEGSIGNTTSVYRVSTAAKGIITTRRQISVTDSTTISLPHLANCEFDVNTGKFYGAKSDGTGMSRIPKEGSSYSSATDDIAVPSAASGYSCAWAGYWWRRNVAVMLLTKAASPSKIAIGYFGITAGSSDWQIFNLMDYTETSANHPFESDGTEVFSHTYLDPDTGMLLFAIKATLSAGHTPYVSGVDLVDVLETGWTPEVKSRLIPWQYITGGSNKFYVSYIGHLRHVIVAGIQSGSPPRIRWGYFRFGVGQNGYMEDEILHQYMPNETGELDKPITEIVGVGHLGDIIVSWRPKQSGESFGGQWVMVSFEDEAFVETWKKFAVPYVGSTGDNRISNLDAQGADNSYSQAYTVDPNPDYVSYNPECSKFTFLGNTSSSYSPGALAGIQLIQSFVPAANHWTCILQNGDYFYEIFDTNNGPAGAVADILRNRRYGAGISNNDIDFNSFEKVEGWCLNRIFVNDQEDLEDRTVPRYTLDIVLDKRAQLLEHTRDMMTNFAGSLVSTNGKVSLVCSRAEAGYVAHFTEADFVESSFSLGVSDPKNIPNRVLIRYFGTTKSSEKPRHRVRRVDDEWDQDQSKEIREAEIDARGISREAPARRMAYTVLHAARAGRLKCTFQSTVKFSFVQAGDIIAVSNPRFSLSRKLFRVVTIEEDTEGKLTYTCSEHRPEAMQDGPRDIQEDDHIPTGIDFKFVPPPARFFLFQWGIEAEPTPKMRVYHTSTPPRCDDPDVDGDLLLTNETMHVQITQGGGSYIEFAQNLGGVYDPLQPFTPKNDNSDATAEGDPGYSLQTTSSLLADTLLSTEENEILLFSTVSNTNDPEQLVPDEGTTGQGSYTNDTSNFAIIVQSLNYDSAEVDISAEAISDGDTLVEVVRYPAVQFGNSWSKSELWPGKTRLYKKGSNQEGKIKRGLEGTNPTTFTITGFTNDDTTGVPVPGQQKFLIVPSTAWEKTWGLNAALETETDLLEAIRDVTSKLTAAAGTTEKLFKKFNETTGGSDWLYIGDTRAFNSMAIKFDTTASVNMQLLIEYSRRDTQTGKTRWWPLGFVYDRTDGFNKGQVNIHVPELNANLQSDRWEWLTFAEPRDWARTFNIRDENDAGFLYSGEMPLLDSTDPAENFSESKGGYFWIRIRRTQKNAGAADLPVVDRIILSRRPYVVFREDRAAYISSVESTTGVPLDPGDYWIRVFNRNTLKITHPLEQRPVGPYILSAAKAYSLGADYSGSRTDRGHPRISELRINGKPYDLANPTPVTVTVGTDVEIEWTPVYLTESYGIHPYGRGPYGGQIGGDFHEFVIRIYNFDTGLLLSEVKIEDPAVTSYTYTAARNVLLSGSFETDLRFDIHQRTGRGLSLPISARTT